MDQRKIFPVMATEYRLLQEIGHGVSATVYEAECIPLGERVAIKSIDLERLNANLDDIRREAQTMSLIDHPNVLRAHCSFIVQHNLWVVMPFMAGGSCQSIMHTSFSTGFEEPVIGLVLKDTLKALHYLHQQGHIHRDVKAGNILIDSKGVVKLADFGVSTSLFESGAHRHKRNTFVGTPCWMAPEVIDHNNGYDHKADIWSFGITALELAHGHAPFSKFPPMKALLMQLQGAPPGFDSAADNKFSRSFREMVGFCLVKDPARRPSAHKLLKHSFFRHTKTSDYIVKHVLENLPPLAERLKMIRAKMQHQQDDDDEDEDGHMGMPHMRRISGWNFNEDNLKFEPMFRSIFDHSNAKDENHNQNISERTQNSDILQCHVDCEPHKPVSSNDVLASGNANSKFTSPNRDCCDADPNQSSNTCCDSGPIAIAGGEPEGLCVNSTGSANSETPPDHKQDWTKEASDGTQMEADKKEGNIQSQRYAHLEEKQQPAVDLISKAAANGTEHSNLRVGHGLKPGMIQKKGRFSVTQADGITNPNKPLVHHPLPPLRRMHSLSSSQPSLSSASGSELLSPRKKFSSHEFNSHNCMLMPISAILPQLQSILHSTLIQQDSILYLLNEMGVGADQTGSSTTMKHTSATERESELTQKISDLQGKVSALLDEVHAIKAKNAQMEHHLNGMFNRVDK